jgi:predicted solute-binding protein
MSKLHLAPPESPEALAERYDHEKRATVVQREQALSHSLAGFRVGSVPYLNAVPLTRGIEEQVIFAPPSELARKLRDDELDAALVSVTEVLFNDLYCVLDGIAIASLGEVKSVVLAHRRPLAEIQTVYCDPASLSSVNLLRVLLMEMGVHAQFEPLASYERTAMPDEVLLIGDPALEFALGPHSHELWDLGAAWYELTRLPFVYAAWVLRRNKDTAELRRLLREAKHFGLDTLDYLIESRADFTRDFRWDYLTWHVHYHLGGDEKRGIARFTELLRKHTPGPVFDPRFVA